MMASGNERAFLDYSTHPEGSGYHFNEKDKLAYLVDLMNMNMNAVCSFPFLLESGFSEELVVTDALGRMSCTSLWCMITWRVLFLRDGWMSRRSGR